MKSSIKSMAIAALAVPLFSTMAWADCTAPAGNVEIPDGNTATKEQLIAAKKAVNDYDALVKQYSECLQAELDSKVAAGADRTKIAPDYAKKNNAEIDKLQAIADKLNVQIKAYKAKTAPPAP